MPEEPPRRPDQEPAHDVLAAEAFALPGPDPDLRQRPVVLPDDPSGIAEPHDILAAEEFAMPAVKPAPGRGARFGANAETGRRFALVAVAGGLLGLLRRRRR